MEEISDTNAGVSEVTDEERLLAILVHASILVGAALVVPLVVYIMKRETNPYVAAHAAEALNFHLSVMIYSVVVLPTVFLLIGIPLIMAIGLGSVIVGIVATVKAAGNEAYRYPLTIRFLR